MATSTNILKAFMVLFAFTALCGCSAPLSPKANVTPDANHAQTARPSGDARTDYDENAECVLRGTVLARTPQRLVVKSTALINDDRISSNPTVYVYQSGPASDPDFSIFEISGDTPATTEDGQGINVYDIEPGAEVLVHWTGPFDFGDPTFKHEEALHSATKVCLVNDSQVS